jgi:hypothetical protein
MDTKRRDFFTLGGLVGAAGLVRQAHADTTDATVAGSWMVQIVYENTTNNLGSKGTHKTAMCQFFDDGRWMGSVSAINPGSSESWPANWRQATYHGEWKRSLRAGNHQEGGMRPDSAVTTQGATVTIQANRMRTDDLGNFVANATTTIQATLSADGSTWAGTFVTVSRAVTGAVGTFTGTLSAVRV